MSRHPHLIAGPTDYSHREDNGKVEVCAWHFIGFKAAGDVLRWRLNYSVELRRFTVTNVRVCNWAQAHAAELQALYLPVAIRRVDLPKGSILVALQAMLPDTDIAKVTALSLTGGRL